MKKLIFGINFIIICFFMNSCTTSSMEEASVDDPYQDLLDTKVFQTAYLRDLMSKSESGLTRSAPIQSVSIEELILPEVVKEYLVQYAESFTSTTSVDDDILLRKIADDVSLSGDDKILLAEIIGNGQYIRSLNCFDVVFQDATTRLAGGITANVTANDCKSRFNKRTATATAAYVASYALAIAGGVTGPWTTAAGIALATTLYTAELASAQTDLDWCMTLVKK